MLVQLSIYMYQSEACNNFISCSMYTLFVRDEIAACTEKAYQCISLPEASRILYFESEKDMRAFAKKVSFEVDNIVCSCYCTSE